METLHSTIQVLWTLWVNPRQAAEKSDCSSSPSNRQTSAASHPLRLSVHPAKSRTGPKMRVLCLMNSPIRCRGPLVMNPSACHCRDADYVIQHYLENSTSAFRLARLCAPFPQPSNTKMVNESTTFCSAQPCLERTLPDSFKSGFG